jgi:hypothetical protein
MHFQGDFPVATSVWNSLVKPWYRHTFSWYSWKFRNQRIFVADFMVHICPINTMKSLVANIKCANDRDGESCSKVKQVGWIGCKYPPRE